jgi:hypothetical protein
MLMHFYHWDEDYVRLKMTSAKSWVYYNFALENQMSVWGAAFERKTDGYVKQETKQIFSKYGGRNRS